jgi:hypothetical protein
MPRFPRSRSFGALLSPFVKAGCLAVLCLGLTTAVAADPLSEFYSCSNTFDSSLGTCLSTYHSCMGAATTNPQRQQCAFDFDDCGSGSVNSYSSCLGGMEDEISVCDQAREAETQCIIDLATCQGTAAEEPDAEGFAISCESIYVECLNASGIWQCE